MNYTIPLTIAIITHILYIYGCISWGQMVHRENIKYIFSRLFLILNNSIPNKVEAGSYEDFENLIDDLSTRGITNQVDIKTRSLIKKAVNSILIFPGVIHAGNNPAYLQLNDEDAHFIGSGIITGKVLYVKNTSELAGKDLSDVIVCIENTTPEIDVFLQKIGGIITKNGGHLAHIAIRAREYKIPSVVGAGNLFNEIKDYSNVKIDFSSQKITAI